MTAAAHQQKVLNVVTHCKVSFESYFKVTFEIKFCVCHDNFGKFSTFESFFRECKQVLFLEVFFCKRSAVIS